RFFLLHIVRQQCVCMNTHKIGSYFFEISNGTDEVENYVDEVVKVSNKRYKVSYWYYDGGSDGRDEAHAGVERYFNKPMRFLF
ncbi:MAG: hypothetical protein KUG73_07075, partial [Pseudomonadales bacterium]|nr:hypothetical protein [Pseudomonadales bacterium]